MGFIEKPNPNFESCEDCIYSDDSDEVCTLRGCIHAVVELKECYKPKQRTGKWLRVPCKFVTSKSYVYQCNKCEAASHFASEFCPHCGAKMKEGEVDEAD